jgi:hypothetical protein
MMGRLNHNEGRLFYSFSLEEAVPVSTFILAGVNREHSTTVSAFEAHPGRRFSADEYAQKARIARSGAYRGVPFAPPPST